MVGFQDGRIASIHPKILDVRRVVTDDVYKLQKQDSKGIEDEKLKKKVENLKLEMVPPFTTAHLQLLPPQV